MGQSTIRDALARKNTQSPQYDYMWRVELPDLSKPTGATLSDGSSDPYGSKILGILDSLSGGLLDQFFDAGGNMEEINHRVSSIDTPYFQMDTKKITSKNTYWYAASNNDIGSISMTIDEFEDGLTYDYLSKWLNLIIRDDGTYNPPAAYKKDIKFIRMSATNLDLHVFMYEDFFLNEISNIQNSYEGNDITQYSVIFTGDSVTHYPIKAAEVKSRVRMAESSIILREWANDKFRMDGLSGADKVRLLSDVSKIFT